MFVLTFAFVGLNFFSQQAWGVELVPVREKNEHVKVANVHGGEAETWEFYMTTSAPGPEELATVLSNHKLGKKVAYLYDSFKETYVVKEEVVPGDPTRRTVIRKPEIYNAVRSIEKELNREMKKNGLSAEKAEAEFMKVLQVALAAVDSDTASFEETLQDNKKDASQLLAVFQRVNLKSIY